MVKPAIYRIRTLNLQRIIDSRHITLQQFADDLGISRSFWSALFHRKRKLTPAMRRQLLACSHLQGFSEDLLWDIELPPATSQSTPLP